MQVSYWPAFGFGDNTVIPAFLDGVNITSEQVSTLQPTDEHVGKDNGVVHYKCTVQPKFSGSDMNIILQRTLTRHDPDLHLFQKQKYQSISGHAVYENSLEYEEGYGTSYTITTDVYFYSLPGNKYYVRTSVLDSRKTQPTTMTKRVYPYQFRKTYYTIPNADDCLKAGINLCEDNPIQDEKLAISDAFREACHNTSPLGINSIATLLEVSDSAKSLTECVKKLANLERNITKKVGKLATKYLKEGSKDAFLNLADTSADMWLSYRYVYTTTKLDIQSCYDNMDSAILSYDSIGGFYYPPVYGRAVTDNATINVKCRMVPQISNKLQELWHKSDIFGLQPNLVNIWDMIPWSFIIDWFLPVEEVCSIIDDKIQYGLTQYDYHEIEISTKRNLDFKYLGALCNISEYKRFFTDRPPELFGSWEQDPSTRTVTYRAADAASFLVKGKKGA